MTCVWKYYFALYGVEKNGARGAALPILAQNDAKVVVFLEVRSFDRSFQAMEANNTVNRRVRCIEIV